VLAEQPESPNAESGRQQSQYNEERIARNLRPFRERLPNVSQGNQAKNRAGGYQIGFHQDQHVNRTSRNVQRGLRGPSSPCSPARASLLSGQQCHGTGRCKQTIDGGLGPYRLPLWALKLLFLSRSLIQRAFKLQNSSGIVLADFKSKRKRPKQPLAGASVRGGGFTLIETLIASGIAAVVMIALFGAFSAGFSAIRLSQEAVRGDQIMVEKLETLRLYNWSQVTNSSFMPTNFTTYFSGTNGVLYNEPSPLRHRRSPNPTAI